MPFTMSNTLNLPEDRTPSVLNRESIWRSVKKTHSQYVDGKNKELMTDTDIEDQLESLSDEDKQYIIGTTRTLRLEFRRILKIDNLDCLTSLTRLFLDNNFIEKITGLDTLVHLVWLDLTFNRIKKIEGLESLKKLQVLALYSNEISVLQNLHHLQKLNVLRIGSNKLKTREDIIYLRKLPNLRTLSIKGNPLCDDPDWVSFVKALLPSLVYLECKPINSEERERAIIKHQGDIFRAEGREEEERTSREKWNERVQSERRHKAAFVDTIRGPVLLKNIIAGSRNQVAEAELIKKLFSSNNANDAGAISLKLQYEEDISLLGDKIHQLGLDELTIREHEIKVFEESLEMAREEAQKKGILSVENFLKKKDEIFVRFYDLASDIEEKEGVEVTDDQREEVERLRFEFRSLAKETWNTVMCQEMTLVTQTEQVLEHFEENLQQLIDCFLDKVRTLFMHGRYIDVRYFKSLSLIGEAMESAAFEQESRPEKELSEKTSNILSRIALCHDAHQEHLLEEEASLQESVEKWAQGYLESFRLRERDRHRARVLELNHFLDSMKREEDEMDNMIPLPHMEDEEQL